MHPDDKALEDLYNLLKEGMSPVAAERFESLFEEWTPDSMISHERMMESTKKIALLALLNKGLE